MGEHHSKDPKDPREEDEGGVAGRGAPEGGSAGKSGAAGAARGGISRGGSTAGGGAGGEAGGMSKAGGAPGGAPTPDQPAPGQRTYTVRPGDNLSRIAKEVYGDASRWKDIYEANKSLIGANPDLIKPGQVLTIP
jgi:nucleoid-associated protein YgaU